MSKNTIEIQEDDLHAYVDQQLSAEKVEAVETLMRKDPQIAQQVHDGKNKTKQYRRYSTKMHLQKSPNS